MARGQILAALVVLGLVAGISADVFLQGCICGSNNKGDEQNDNANNQNRLFNSQNGAGGGCTFADMSYFDSVYAGPEIYYVGSKVPLYWTAQHASGSTNNNLDSTFVIQTMCSVFGPNSVPPLNFDITGAKDGKGTDTPTTDAQTSNAAPTGRMEPWDYYNWCANTQRNTGLYVADQNVGTTKTSTRTNAGGTRYGLECPEERDYYPFFHPTPFVDVAVLSSRWDKTVYGTQTYCQFVASNSQNVVAKGWCKGATGTARPNNREDCVAANFAWEEIGAWNTLVPPPECRDAPFTFENSLGMSTDFRPGMGGGYLAGYNYTVANIPTEYPNDPVNPFNPAGRCFIRLRYNVSQADVAWETDFESNGNGPEAPVTQDPFVVFAQGGSFAAVPLGLRINTNQFFRIFQDRSQSYRVHERPESLGLAGTIYNLGRIGMRGALQNIFPMMENDFCPKKLSVAVGDFIRVSWSGRAFGAANNRNNGAGAAQGIGGTRANRANMVMVPARGIIPYTYEETMATNFFDNIDQYVMSTYANQPIQGCRLDQPTNGAICPCTTTNPGETADNNCGKLNNADTHMVDFIISVTATKIGDHKFVDTRNSITTNRDSHGYISIDLAIPAWAVAVIVVASVILVGAIIGAGVMYTAAMYPSGAAASFVNKVRKMQMPWGSNRY